MKIHPKLYSQIIVDRRIPHGAFRLWHLFRDRQGQNPNCWPGLGTICRTIKCGRASVLEWTELLVANGYLSVIKGSRARSNRYTVCGSEQNQLGGSNVH